MFVCCGLFGVGCGCWVLLLSSLLLVFVVWRVHVLYVFLLFWLFCVVVGVFFGGCIVLLECGTLLFGVLVIVVSLGCVLLVFLGPVFEGLCVFGLFVVFVVRFDLLYLGAGLVVLVGDACSGGYWDWFLGLWYWC